MDIYTILSSKPHNIHYLQRYFKFIERCKLQQVQSRDVYYEKHHICPKAKDLFPEYSNLIKHSWNCICLTYRQHFIAHWLLWKTYGNSQMYAFYSMINQNKDKLYSANSRIYEKVKSQVKNNASIANKGYAMYLDSNGLKIRCQTNDIRVLNKELVAVSFGRKYSPRSTESKQKSIDASRKNHPNKTIRLYKNIDFIDYTYEKNYPEKLIEKLNEGWTRKKTIEYRRKYEPIIRQPHTEETKQKMSITRTGKIRKTREQKIQFKINNNKFVYCYNVETGIFSDEVDFDIQLPFVKVFTRKGNFYKARTIDNRSVCINSICPLPENYHIGNPNSTTRYYNTEKRIVEYVMLKDVCVIHILLIARNNNRIKLLFNDKPIYYPKDLFERYGLPLNCQLFIYDMRV